LHKKDLVELRKPELPKIKSYPIIDTQRVAPGFLKSSEKRTKLEKIDETESGETHQYIRRRAFPCERPWS